jgi:type I restriction enzyme S subunit
MSEWKESEIGRIPNKWKLSTLGEISSVLTDGAHFSPKESKTNFYMASVKDMRYNHFNFTGCKTIAIDDFNNLVENNCSPFYGDILISKDGANCLDLIFVYKQPQKIVLLSSIAIARLKDGYDPDFYRYFLLSPDIQSTMRNNYVSGSAIPRVVLKDFRNVPVPVLGLKEQQSIASILSSLDDKIDLLHRQNTTLEKMAETLFRQWFVEEAKEEWEEKSLYDVIELIGGGTPKTSNPEYWNGNIKWLSGGDIANNHKNILVTAEKTITDVGLKNSSTKLLPKFSTIISARGTVGKYCMLAEPMAFSQSNYGIVPKIKDCYFFTYLLIAHSVDELQSAAHGSVFDTITTNTFKGISLLIPSNNEILEFELQVKSLFYKMLNNQTQIHTLTTLRDTLLPKLMSGEVRVSEL